MPGKKGRPSKFFSIDQKKLKVLVQKGFTDTEISDFFDVNQATFNDWKKEHKDFYESLKDWKLEADAKVEKSLYQRALGYEYDEVMYEKTDIGGLGVKLSKGEIEQLKHVDTYKTKVTVKQVAPDVTAQIFWLKNRKPDVWKDRSNIEHSVPDELLEKFAGAPITDLINKANALITGKSK